MKPMRLKISFFLMSAILITSGTTYTYAGEKAGTTSDLTLKVALYPYVPDPARMEKAVSEEWAELHPEVGLDFIEWDCYHEDPSEKGDLFVFDAIYLTEFAEQGSLLPIPENKIQNKTDLLPFSVEGCSVDGNMYAIPQILCTNLLFTRKTDAELASVQDIVSLYHVLGERISQTPIPGKNEGLLVDMTGGTGKVTMCLDAMMDLNQAYSEYEEELELSDIPEDAMEPLKLLCKMGGEKQVLYSPEEYEAYLRARWFSEGKGRAYIGYTESMSVMGDYVDQVEFRPFSFTAEDDISVLFCDAVGIYSGISEDKKELAFELLNVISGEDTMVKAISPVEEGQSPQYLLPARDSVYDRLKVLFPVYDRLKEIASDPENHIFRIGSQGREDISEIKGDLSEQIFDSEETEPASE